MKITIDIPEEAIANALCSACEGGSGYWARTDRYPYKEDSNGRDERLGYVPLKLRLPVTVREDENDDLTFDTRHTLDLIALKRGLTLMAQNYPEHFADLMTEEGDASTGDVLLQLATLGELRYG